MAANIYTVVERIFKLSTLDRKIFIRDKLKDSSRERYLING